MHCSRVVGARPQGPHAARLRWARRAARVAEWLVRFTHVGGGGVIGGRVLLAVDPSAAVSLAEGRQVLAVSGTNGKSTTTAFLTAVLADLGAVDTNADGANTRPGMVKALSGDAPRVVLETDEGWLPWLLSETRPAITVLLNLSRDQLHRHHEVARLARSWADSMSGLPYVVGNSSDPAVVLAALRAKRQTWIEAPHAWRLDDLICPACGDELHDVDADWWCECGLRRPPPDWRVLDDVLVGEFRGQQVAVPLELALPGPANLANAAMAIAAAVRLGVDPYRAAQVLRDIHTVAGRYAVVQHHGRQVRLLLAKNPASWTEALGMLGDADSLVLAFNSEGVDGRDPSWLYDVPFEALRGRQVIATGRRGTDMLVRLRTAGVTTARQVQDVRQAVDCLPAGGVTMIANYSAFQQARRAFAS